MKKKTILILSDWFDPAYKAGGPITSLVNFCQKLSDSYQLFVFTSNHDLDPRDKLKAVDHDHWGDWNGHAEVYYNSQKTTRKHLLDVLKSIQPDFLYLNSMFSYRSTLLPLRVINGLEKVPQVVLNPRGMLLPSALLNNPLKKKFFLLLFRKNLIWNQVRWQHSSTEEERSTIEIFGEGIQSKIVENFSATPQTELNVIKKESGVLRLMFVGRIHPVKNLSLTLDALKGQKDQIILSVYGAIESQEYYQVCIQKIHQLPKNITVNFNGSVKKDELRNAYEKHHFLILPSRGENYGHAITEAWACARPVLISNKTPWDKVEEKQIGFMSPIQNHIHLTQSIEKLSQMNNTLYQSLSENSYLYAEALSSQPKLKVKYQELFL